MDDKKRGEFLRLAEASSIGWMFPIAMGLGFGAGWLLDKLFGTWPWCTAVFTGFGVVAAFLNLFRIGTRADGG
ncbi:MAG TPA: AtpZ/AtpI family protein [Thermoanaerobaculia bacterium]|jgi:F0F1-type ATP synthase assembly protein I